jgi:hypothetical protein
MALKSKRRLRTGLNSALRRVGAYLPHESFSLSAEIPGFTPDQPLWRLKLEMLSEAHGDGQRLRLRGHFQASLANALAPTPSGAHAISSPETGTALAETPRVGTWLRAALSKPGLRRFAAPLLRHDFNSWIDVRASTADLVDGASALLPERLQLQTLGIDTTGDRDGFLAQTWAGNSDSGPPGHAQISLLQLDKRHLPTKIAALIGDKPFQLVAALVAVVEEKAPSPAAKATSK